MKLAFAWLFVIVPLGWGVMKSIEKSKPLFQQKAAVKSSP
jgi:hypothetical protein